MGNKQLQKMKNREIKGFAEVTLIEFKFSIHREASIEKLQVQDGLQATKP